MTSLERTSAAISQANEDLRRYNRILVTIVAVGMAALLALTLVFGFLNVNDQARAREISLHNQVEILRIVEEHSQGQRFATLLLRCVDNHVDLVAALALGEKPPKPIPGCPVR